MKGRTVFQKLFSKNRRYKTRGITLLVHHDIEIIKPAIAICVSHRLGNAVKRNRLKRITREGIDTFISKITGKCYMAFMPDGDFDKVDFTERAHCIKKLLIEAGLMKNGKT